MAFIGLIFHISVAIVCFFLLCLWRNNRNSPHITNWPVLGMLPGLLHNAWRLHDFAAEVLEKTGGNFVFAGPWFPKLDFLVTCDPVNLHHILSRNFANYEKGSEFKEIFEPLGEGIFNADSDSWRVQRKMIQAMVKNSKFELYWGQTVWSKVMRNLIPALEHFAEHGTKVDLQDVIQRFTFDYVCLLVLGVDPNSLSIEFPDVLYEKAFDDIEEAIIYRHVLPKNVWKLQKWLQIGEEKRLKTAWDRFDSFLYQCISRKQEQLMSESKIQVEEDGFDLLTALMVAEKEEEDNMKSDKFVRDIAFNLMVAGRDTVASGLSWFFWLVATHPSVETKILEEIKSNIPPEEDGSKQFKMFTTKELTNSFVYLHAALCETLRMYPPVPINEKTAVEADKLPSGHRVDRNTRILIPFYAMARMQEIWGEDCLEFKPERWISEQGGVIHVPSYKFPAFNSGPRTCLGKDMSFIQLKIVAISVLWHYHIEVVQGHSVFPSSSVVLFMTNGLKVGFTKRFL